MRAHDNERTFKYKWPYFKIQGEINLVGSNNTVEPRHYRTLVSNHKSTLCQLFCLLRALLISSCFKKNLTSQGIEPRSHGPLCKIMATTPRAPLISSLLEATFYHQQRTRLVMEKTVVINGDG